MATQSQKRSYVYDTKPSFKRAASHLDIKAVDAEATFYGNLVISCTGRSPCYSKFSKLLLSITQNQGPEREYRESDDDSKVSSKWSDDARMTIRGALWTKSEKLRTYFIALLENTESNTKYQKLYENLCNEKYKISDDKAEFILDSLVSMVKANDEQILQCLSNFKCTQQSRPLWNELQDNDVENEDLNDQQAIVDKIDEIRSRPFYQDMVAKGVELDDNEILAIYIYAANEEFADLMQKHLKLPCKWKQTFYYFVRGILKIYDCKVYGSKREDLPNNLYHPVFLSYDRNRPVSELRLLTTINCTSELDAAKDFAPPDGSMFVVADCAESLRNGSLIGAPIDWISPHPNENEWVLMPCTFIECHKPVPFVHNSVLISVAKYQSVKPQFFGVDIFTKLSHLKFVQDLSNESSANASVVVKDLKYYQRECNSLRAELYALKAQFGIDISDNNNDTAPVKEEQKVDIKIPFKKVESEAYLIEDRSVSASMCVTNCDGELNPPFISAKAIQYLKENYESNGLDIFVDTYAKCGTTVGIKMVYKILEANNQISAGSNKQKLNDPWNAVPWIEVDVSQQLLTSPSPNDFLSFIEHSNQQKQCRIWKTHAPINNFPTKALSADSKLKIIHIIRNPKDVVCSYFDFFKKEPLVNYCGDFDTLFDWFCDGTVVHSSVFDFELNWFRAQQRNGGVLSEEQLLIIAYEDIVRKPKEIVRKVSTFLGFDEQSMDSDTIESVCKAISFEQSKKEAQVSSDIAVIVNKGKIGRWKGILSQQQSDRIDRIINTRLKQTNIQFTFE